MSRASLTLALLFVAGFAVATTYTIYPDGSGDFATIQEALEDTVGGDVVRLGDGIFAGPGNRDLYTTGEPVTYESISGDPDLCIIDCQGSSGDPHFGIQFQGEDGSTIMRGITIMNAYASVQGGALRLVNASPQVINCVFRNNTAYNYGGAVHGSGPSIPYFQDCWFENNFADYYGQGGAVYTDEDCSPEFDTCTFIDNTSSEGSAIFGNAGASVTVRQSTFSNNGYEVIKVGEDSALVLEHSILAYNTGSAVECFANASVSVSCTCISGNLGGNWVDCLTGLSGVDGNIEANPDFCNASGGNFKLHGSSPCAPLNNPGCGLIGAWPVGCWDITTVEADGAGDYATIQDAVDAAMGTGGEIIELLDGVYSGVGNYDVDFQGKALTIRSQSGNPEACIIDPDASEFYPRRAFLFNSGEGPTSVLEGLTFTDCVEDFGGAIRVNESAPTINNCIFKANESLTGALYILGQLGEEVVTVSGCTFIGNTNYGDFGFGSAVTTEWGGAFEFNDCQFIDNTTTGLLPENGLGGAVTVFNPVGSFTHCTFAHNTASGYGGAIVAGGQGYTLQITNCTFVDNSAPAGGTIFNEETNLIIQNSIIAFGQDGGSISENTDYPGTYSLSCTDIYGNEGGDWVSTIIDQWSINGNSSVNPQFCDIRLDDFHLTASSPCAPFSPPNQYCELIGAWPVGCDYAPAISSVTDVGNDQGRRARVSWNRSPQDYGGSAYDVTQYSVWRRLDGRSSSSAKGEVLAERDGRYPPGDWDYVTSVPARGEASYSVVAETLCDSTIVDGLCLSTFFVSAETSETLIFFDSEPESGYSVDNLSPGVPANFRMESSTLLAWDENTDADFDYYSVYGSSVDVLDESAVLIDHTSSTSLDITGEAYSYYLLTASDFSGNESSETVVSGVIVSAPDELPTAVALRPNHPNPFNPHTEIRYELPETAVVSLMIYDVSGRLVRRLIDGDTVNAGRYSITWQGRDDAGRELSSGIYFTRFDAAGESHIGKLTLLR